MPNETAGAGTASAKKVKTVNEVWEHIRGAPFRFLFNEWNWKAAVWSGLIRALVFFVILIRGGWRAAMVAMSAEALFRVVMSGLFGSLMQAFRNAQPQWKAFGVSAVLGPAIVQIAEFGMHWRIGSPQLVNTTLASCALTVSAGLFQWHAMHRGAMLIGTGQQSFMADLKAIPGLLISFLFGWMRLPKTE